MYIDLLQIQRSSFLKFLQCGIYQVFDNMNPIIIANRKYIFFSKYYLLKIPSQIHFTSSDTALDQISSLGFHPISSLDTKRQVKSTDAWDLNKNFKWQTEHKSYNVHSLSIKTFKPTPSSFLKPYQTNSYNDHVWPHSLNWFEEKTSSMSNVASIPSLIIPFCNKLRFEFNFAHRKTMGWNSSNSFKTKQWSLFRFLRNNQSALPVGLFRFLRNNQSALPVGLFLGNNRNFSPSRSIKIVGFFSWKNRETKPVGKNVPSHRFLFDTKLKSNSIIGLHPNISLRFQQEAKLQQQAKHLKKMRHCINHDVKPSISSPIVPLKAKEWDGTQLTYSSEFYIPVQIIDTISKKVSLRWLLLADLPIQTKRGHFIINGYPKTIIHQIVRSPGIRFKNEDNHILADIISMRGAWMGIQIIYEKNLKINRNFNFSSKSLNTIQTTPKEEIFTDRKNFRFRFGFLPSLCLQATTSANFTIGSHHINSHGMKVYRPLSFLFDKRKSNGLNKGKAVILSESMGWKAWPLHRNNKKSLLKDKSLMFRNNKTWWNSKKIPWDSKYPIGRFLKIPYNSSKESQKMNQACVINFYLSPSQNEKGDKKKINLQSLPCFTFLEFLFDRPYFTYNNYVPSSVTSSLFPTLISTDRRNLSILPEEKASLLGSTNRTQSIKWNPYLTTKLQFDRINHNFNNFLINQLEKDNYHAYFNPNNRINDPIVLLYKHRHNFTTTLVNKTNKYLASIPAIRMHFNLKKQHAVFKNRMEATVYKFNDKRNYRLSSSEFSHFYGGSKAFSSSAAIKWNSNRLLSSLVTRLNKTFVRDILFERFMNPKFYDIGYMGRKRLNKKLRLNIPLQCTTLTPLDFLAIFYKLFSYTNNFNLIQSYFPNSQPTLGQPVNGNSIWPFLTMTHNAGSVALRSTQKTFYASNLISSPATTSFFNNDTNIKQTGSLDHLNARHIRTCGEFLFLQFWRGILRYYQILSQLSARSNFIKASFINNNKTERNFFLLSTVSLDHASNNYKYHHFPKTAFSLNNTIKSPIINDIINPLMNNHSNYYYTIPSSQTKRTGGAFISNAWNSTTTSSQWVDRFKLWTYKPSLNILQTGPLLKHFSTPSSFSSLRDNHLSLKDNDKSGFLYTDRRSQSILSQKEAIISSLGISLNRTTNQSMTTLSSSQPDTISNIQINTNDFNSIVPYNPLLPIKTPEEISNNFRHIDECRRLPLYANQSNRVKFKNLNLNINLKVKSNSIGLVRVKNKTNPQVQAPTDILHTGNAIFWRRQLFSPKKSEIFMLRLGQKNFRFFQKKTLPFIKKIVYETRELRVFDAKERMRNLETKLFNGVFKEFFNSDPLSQDLDETNGLSEIIHKRRISALGKGGVTSKNAPLSIRSIHPSFYGRLCPIDSPEGDRVGLINSLTNYARITSIGYIATPFYRTRHNDDGSILRLSSSVDLNWKQSINTSFVSLYNNFTIPNVQMRICPPLAFFGKMYHSYSISPSLRPSFVLSSLKDKMKNMTILPTNPFITNTNIKEKSYPLTNHSYQRKQWRFFRKKNLEASPIDVNQLLFHHHLNDKKIFYPQKQMVFYERIPKSSSDKKKNFLLKEKAPFTAPFRVHRLKKQRGEIQTKQVDIINFYDTHYMTPPITYIESLPFLRKSHSSSVVNLQQSLRSNLFVFYSKRINDHKIGVLPHVSYRAKRSSLRNGGNPSIFVKDSDWKHNEVKAPLDKQILPLDRKASPFDSSKRRSSSCRPLILILREEATPFFHRPFNFNIADKQQPPLTLMLQETKGGDLVKNKAFTPSEAMELIPSAAARIEKSRDFDSRWNPNLLSSVSKKSPYTPFLTGYFDFISFQGYAPLTAFQFFSPGVGLIPFLEHDDGTRALMGANMQRQAIPLISASRPIVGTGLEKTIAACFVIVSTHSGYTYYVSGKQSKQIFLMHSNFPFNPFLKRPRLNTFTNSRYHSVTSNQFTWKRGLVSLCSWNKRKSTKGWKFTPWESLASKQPSFRFSSSQMPLLFLSSVVYGKHSQSVSPKGEVSRWNQKNDFETTQIQQKTPFDFYPIASLKLQRQLKTNKLPFYIKSTHWLPYRKSYKATTIQKKPAVNNSWVQKGDVLVDGTSSIQGELSLGRNLFSIYMPWEGYNFEDAILISDRAAQEYTTIHVEEFSVKISKNEFVSSIIQPFTWVNNGDILVSKKRKLENEFIMNRLLFGMSAKSKNSINDSTSLSFYKDNEQDQTTSAITSQENRWDERLTSLPQKNKGGDLFVDEGVDKENTTRFSNRKASPFDSSKGSSSANVFMSNSSSHFSSPPQIDLQQNHELLNKTFIPNINTPSAWRLIMPNKEIIWNSPHAKQWGETYAIELFFSKESTDETYRWNGRQSLNSFQARLFNFPLITNSNAKQQTELFQLFQFCQENSLYKKLCIYDKISPLIENFILNETIEYQLRKREKRYKNQYFNNKLLPFDFYNYEMNEIKKIIHLFGSHSIASRGIKTYKPTPHSILILPVVSSYQSKHQENFPRKTDSLDQSSHSNEIQKQAKPLMIRKLQKQQLTNSMRHLKQMNRKPRIHLFYENCRSSFPFRPKGFAFRFFQRKKLRPYFNANSFSSSGAKKKNKDSLFIRNNHNFLCCGWEKIFGLFFQNNQSAPPVGLFLRNNHNLLLAAAEKIVGGLESSSISLNDSRSLSVGSKLWSESQFNKFHNLQINVEKHNLKLVKKLRLDIMYPENSTGLHSIVSPEAKRQAEPEIDTSYRTSESICGWVIYVKSNNIRSSSSKVLDSYSNKQLEQKKNSTVDSHFIASHDSKLEIVKLPVKSHLYLSSGSAYRLGLISRLSNFNIAWREMKGSLSFRNNQSALPVVSLGKGKAFTPFEAMGWKVWPLRPKNNLKVSTNSRFIPDLSGWWNPTPRKFPHNSLFKLGWRGKYKNTFNVQINRALKEKLLYNYTHENSACHFYPIEIFNQDKNYGWKLLNKNPYSLQAERFYKDQIPPIVAVQTKRWNKPKNKNHNSYLCWGLVKKYNHREPKQWNKTKEIKGDLIDTFQQSWNKTFTRSDGVKLKLHALSDIMRRYSQWDENRSKHNSSQVDDNLIIYLAVAKPLQVGDKMSGRHGNKGIISKILPYYDMPYLIDGTPIDIVLNPLGVPSRMNVGQIYESLLGYSGFYKHEYYRLPPFDENYSQQFSRNFVYWKLHELNKLHYFGSSIKETINSKKGFQITPFFERRNQALYTIVSRGAKQQSELDKIKLCLNKENFGSPFTNRRSLSIFSAKKTCRLRLQIFSEKSKKAAFFNLNLHTTFCLNFYRPSPFEKLRRLYQIVKNDKIQMYPNYAFCLLLPANLHHVKKWSTRRGFLGQYSSISSSKSATKLPINTVQFTNGKLIGWKLPYIKRQHKFHFITENYKKQPKNFSYNSFFLRKNRQAKPVGETIGYNPYFPGKMRLLSGINGEPFYRPVIVGKSYMLKLIHLVHHKIHARATGPYALITQQPLKGKRNQGGQRMGEMEIWALYGFGSASILYEMLTIKSDDPVGRERILREIAGYKGKISKENEKSRNHLFPFSYNIPPVTSLQTKRWRGRWNNREASPLGGIIQNETYGFNSNKQSDNFGIHSIASLGAEQQAEPEKGIAESFRVLVMNLRALCLDMQVFKDLSNFSELSQSGTVV